MRMLIINPNTTSAMTKAIEKTARTHAASTTELVCMTAPDGPRAIETAYDSCVAAYHVLNLVSQLHCEFDAIMIACGANPGLEAARTITSRPVAGIGESAMLTACSVAEKFSVIMPAVHGGAAAGWEEVRSRGLERRCASVRMTSKNVLDGFFLDQKEMFEMLVAAGKPAVELDGANSLVLLCAGMTGTKDALERALKVPVIDGVIAATKALEQFGQAAAI